MQSRERIDFVDILRGFAVYGILVMNITAFSGQETNLASITDPIDRTVVLLVNFLFQAKFYSLFSFLFGWGMAIQLERAQAKGIRFLPRFVRRIFILLIIGALHTIFIWDGDILVLYALLGFLLLLLRNRSEKVILTGVALSLLLPIVMTAPGEWMETVRNGYENLTSFMRLGTPSREILATGTYPEIVRHNFVSTLQGYSRMIYYVGNVFSMFLLGLVVGKRKIFQNITQYIPLVQIVLWVGLLIGVVFNAIFVYASANPGWVPQEYQRFVTVSARTIGAPGLMLFYVAGIILLLQKKSWQERLAPLGNVGRMALSNYLLQSILCTLIFYSYGLGIYGETSATFNQVLVVIVFLAQIRLSAWWFEHYQFGPMEWVWRTLTYAKRPPMRIGETYQDLKPPAWIEKARRLTARVNPLTALVAAWLILIVWGIGLFTWKLQLDSLQSEAPFEVIAKVTATPQPAAASNLGEETASQDEASVGEQVTPEAQIQPASDAQSGDVWALASRFNLEAALDHIKMLSSPSYLGRPAASPGGWAAGDYIAAHFERYGLLPGGDQGTYFQSFPVVYTPLAEMPSLVVIGQDGVEYDHYQLHRDFSPIVRWYSGPGESSGTVAWAGNCAAPDFIELDVVDKIVMCNGGAGAIEFRESSRNALEHGAAGLFMLTDPKMRPADMGSTYYETWVPEPIPSFWVYPSLAGDLLSGSGISVSELLSSSEEIAPFDLAVKVSLTVTTAGQDACAVSGCQARNVLGVLPGRDPAFEGDIVILGAHYDHLGNAPDGTVWPGANDDASGVALLLEIARSWQEQGYTPRRTVVFAAWDAEEIGLIGSRYYVDHPSYPLDSTVAVFQLDMVGAGPGPLYTSGDEALSSEIYALAGELGIQIEASNMGRSDHVPFLEAGIPASMLIYFNEPATYRHYHRPADGLEVIEEDKLEAAARVVEIATLDLVESEPAIQNMLAWRTSAIEKGNSEAFLSTSHPDQNAVDLFWFEDLQALAPIQVEIEPLSIQVSGAEASADVQIRVEYAGKALGVGKGVRSGSLSARFTRSGGEWVWAGPNLEIVAGADQEPNIPGFRVAYPPEQSSPPDLGRLAAEKYAELAQQLGLPGESDATLMLLPDPEAIRVSTALSLLPDPQSWVTANEIKLVYSEEISQSVSLEDALAQHLLARAGVTREVAPWLWEGLPLVFQGQKDPVNSQSKYIPKLADFLKSGQLPPGEVNSWAATDYLLWRLGWQGLGAFITDLGAACQRGECATDTGLDNALQNSLQMDAASFEKFYQEHWMARLDNVQAGLDAVLSARVQAALSGSDSDLAAFLNTVDTQVPHLLAEESYWFQDLQGHPLNEYSLEAKPLVLLEDGSVLAEVKMQYHHAHAQEETGKAVSTRIVFTRNGSAYRWAGAPLETLASEGITIRYPSGMDELAQGLLTLAQQMVPEIAARLDIDHPDDIGITLFDNKDGFRTSISLAFPAVDWVPGWTARNTAIKLQWRSGAEAQDYKPTLAVQLTRNLLHQMGVEVEWFLKGTSTYLSAPFDGRSTEKAAAADLPELSIAADEAGLTDLQDLQRDEELSEEAFQRARTQAWDAFRYLVNTVGWDSILGYFSTQNQGANSEQTFQNQFGQSLASFQNAWIDSLSTGHIQAGWIAVAGSFNQQQANLHIERLANRELAGRKAGSPGSITAAAYIAEQFQEYGLTPAGDLENTSYWQNFPISDTNYIDTPSFELLGEGSQPRLALAFRDEFLALRPVIGSEKPVSGELVWVYDKEVQNVDLSGKIILLKISGALADKGAWEEELAWALEQHASALIMVGNKREAEEILVKQPDLDYLALASEIPVLELTQMGFERLLEAIGHDRKSIQALPSGESLGVYARVAFNMSELQFVETANVLGLLRGSDPYLSRELVILGAHYDHVGDDPDSEVCLLQEGSPSQELSCETLPGKQYSGVNDNASGVAVLLEIARLWQESGYRPRRSVLFAAWGAQEPGQLGSRYFLEYPTLPLSDLVGMVQLDGVAGGEGFQPGAQGEWASDGNLLFSLESASRILDQPFSTTTKYQVSDHYSFEAIGTPSVLVSWRLANEDNLPDGLAPSVIAERFGMIGRLVSLAVMSLTR